MQSSQIVISSDPFSCYLWLFSIVFFCCTCIQFLCGVLQLVPGTPKENLERGFYWPDAITGAYWTVSKWWRQLGTLSPTQGKSPTGVILAWSTKSWQQGRRTITIALHSPVIVPAVLLPVMIIVLVVDFSHASWLRSELWMPWTLTPDVTKSLLCMRWIMWQSEDDMEMRSETRGMIRCTMT